jgi:hypothetical protein
VIEVRVLRIAAADRGVVQGHVEQREHDRNNLKD